MALKITNECINCDVCEDVCPNQAISYQDPHFKITPQLCTECVGHFDSPRCQVVCPVDCIEIDEQHKETKAELQNKFIKLQNEK